VSRFFDAKYEMVPNKRPYSLLWLSSLVEMLFAGKIIVLSPWHIAVVSQITFMPLIKQSG